MKLTKWLVVSLILVPVVYVMMALWANSVLGEMLKDAYLEQQIANDKYMPQFIADLKDLSAAPIFQVSKRKANADQLLVHYVDMEGGQKADTDRSQFFLFMDRISKEYKWKKNLNELKRLLNDPELLRQNVSWIAQLSKYDYWDVNVRPEVLDKIKKASEEMATTRIVMMAQIPVADLMGLEKAAFVFLLQEIKSGRVINGLRYYRHVAGLIHSSNDFVGNMAVMAMLNRERDVVETLGLDGWKPVPEILVTKFKRASYAWVGILSSAWFLGLPKELIPYYQVSTVGFCGGVSEISALPGGLSDFFEPTFFLEMTAKDRIQNYREQSRKYLALCGKEYLSVLLNTVPFKASTLFVPLKYWSDPGVMADPSRKMGWRVTPNPIYVPFVRRFIGIKLLEIARFPYWKYYE